MSYIISLLYLSYVYVMATVSHGVLFLDYPVFGRQYIPLEQCVLYTSVISQKTGIFISIMRNENSAGVTELLCF